MNIRHDAHQHGECTHTAPADTRVKDPVCGMTVDPQIAKHRTTHASEDYVFCSAGCRQKCEADPAKYLHPETQAAKQPPAPAGTIYTCPMHPQIRQVGPGSCPICGMALEPEVATADTGPSAERVDMQRRLWIGLALAAPVVILEMGRHLFNLHMLVSPAVSNWIQFAL